MVKYFVASSKFSFILHRVVHFHQHSLPEPRAVTEVQFAAAVMADV